jgi:hypothetical protein
MRLTKASMPWMPVAVMLAPSASSGDSRHAGCTMRDISLLKCPSMWRISPSVPLATTRFISRIDGQKRLSCPTASTTPAFSHAAIARSAPARVSASGFSQSTALPAAAAATI